VHSVATHSTNQIISNFLIAQAMNSFKPATIYFLVFLIYFLVLFASAAFAQPASNGKVVITGVRFAYPLVEKWINDYKTINPSVQVSIDPRSTVDPANFDLLIEAYEPNQNVKDSREFFYFGRYALLPVANSTSEFAKNYGTKGLTEKQIKEIFFQDIFAEKKNKGQITSPVTIYTRLQRAGAPITFAHYFGFEQQNIKGKAISGSDEHLIKALLKDSTGVSYASLGLLYNSETRKVSDGLTVIPVDQNGDGRISNDEKQVNDVDALVAKLESHELKNIPVEYLHISISKTNTNQEALNFLIWVFNQSQNDLHHFGYLNHDPQRFQKEKEKLSALTTNYTTKK
jgi:phosphate transport system substrate-binding protein